MDERRGGPRVCVRVTARGTVAGGGEPFPFTGETVDLSDGGIGVRLSDDSATRFRETFPAPPAAGTPCKVVATSYVVENLRADGTLRHVGTGGGGTTIGIEFSSLSAEMARIRDELLEVAPDLAEARRERRPLAGEQFASITEFFATLSEFSVASDKTEVFTIGGERYMFVGMHINEEGEIHTECIESVDRKNFVFCPDCKRQINPGDLR